MIDIAVATQCLKFVISKFPQECEVTISAMGSDGESYCITLENLATLSFSMKKKLNNTYSYEVVFPPRVTTRKEACDFVDKNVRWKYWSSFSWLNYGENKCVLGFGFGARKLHRMFNYNKKKKQLEEESAPPPPPLSPNCTFYEFCLLRDKFQGNGYIDFVIRPEGVLIEDAGILRALLPKEIYEAAEKRPPLPPLELKYRPRVGLESGTDSEKEEEEEKEKEEEGKKKEEEERKENVDVRPNYKNCLLLFKDPSELCKHFTDVFPKVYPTQVLLQQKFLQFIREKYGEIDFTWYDKRSNPSKPKLGISLVQGAEAMDHLHQQFVTESKRWPKSVVFNDYVETYKKLHAVEAIAVVVVGAKEQISQV